MAFVGVYTMTETGVIMKEGFDTSVISCFDQQGGDDVAYRSGSGTAYFGSDIGDAVMNHSVLGESWLIQCRDFGCFKNSALVDAYVYNDAAFFHFHDHLLRYKHRGSASFRMYCTNDDISAEQLIL